MTNSTFGEAAPLSVIVISDNCPLAISYSPTLARLRLSRCNCLLACLLRLAGGGEGRQVCGLVFRAAETCSGMGRQYLGLQVGATGCIVVVRAADMCSGIRYSV